MAPAACWVIPATGLAPLMGEGGEILGDASVALEIFEQKKAKVTKKKWNASVLEPLLPSFSSVDSPPQGCAFGLEWSGGCAVEWLP